jgi:hypothetical protein
MLASSLDSRELHAGVERRMSIDDSNTSTREPTDEVMNDHYIISCSPCSQARWTPGKAGLQEKPYVEKNDLSK